MKVQFSRDELWPWYVLYKIEENEHDFGLDEIDIPEDKIDWIMKVQRDFRKVQIYLEQFDKDK